MFQGTANDFSETIFFLQCQYYIGKILIKKTSQQDAVLEVTLAKDLPFFVTESKWDESQNRPANLIIGQLQFPLLTHALLAHHN